VVRIKTLYAGSRYLDRGIADVQLLGGGALVWRQTPSGMEATLPADAGKAMPYVLRNGFTR